MLAACHSLPERRRKSLRFATFTTRDVRLQDLRVVAKESQTAVHKTLKSVGVTGSISRLEASFPDWTDEVHPHTHVILDSAPSGRSFIPRAEFTEAWREHLPEELHAPESEVHIETIRDIVATSAYVTKSPFYDYVKEQADIERTISVITALHGLPKLVAKGSLKLPN